MFFKLDLFTSFLVVLNAFVLNYVEKKTSDFCFQFRTINLPYHDSFSIFRENWARNSETARLWSKQWELARLQSSVGSQHCLHYSLANPKKVRSFDLRQSRYKKCKTRTRSIVQHTSASRKRECQKKIDSRKLGFINELLRMRLK